MTDSKQLSLSILGREFQVACPSSDEATLLQAHALVERKMREIKDSGSSNSTDKIAIMAALNIAFEFMQTSMTGGLDVADFQRRIARMQTVLDAALAD